MRSRFLAELTTPEAEAYLARGGSLAILPVGCVEMHGPHQPIGTDSIIGKAFALVLAESGDGLVLPTVHYTWAGSTDGFAGTLSIEPDMVQRMVEMVLLRAYRSGWRRLIALSVHHGNHYPLYLAVRQIYEKHHIPAVYINPLHPFDEEMAALFAGEYEQSMEASVVLAALHVLGQPALYSEQEMCYDDQAPPGPASRGQIARIGAVGAFMQDVRHHACPSRHVSLQRGLDFIQGQVQRIVPILEHIDQYIADTEAQENKGWWGRLGPPSFPGVLGFR